jgi:hypothetical protein
MRILAAIATLAVLAVYLVVSGGAWGPAPRDDGLFLTSLATGELKQKHAPFGVRCADCHGADMSFAEVPPTAQCLACHESYEALAEQTAGLIPNPHHSHMGDVTCTSCHSEHFESRMSCNQCHVFEMEVP